MPCNSQSAPARSNSCLRSWNAGIGKPCVVLTMRSSARNGHEPGQVRKEAAVSGYVLVLGECLVRAAILVRLGFNDQGQVHGPN